MSRHLLLAPAAVLVAAAASGLAFLAPRSAAANPTLKGTVGPGFTITLKDSSGETVKHLDPGTYVVEVSDLSNSHDFHLFGPGVEESTSIEGTGNSTWTVTFTDGTYHYRCDAHPTQMSGEFTVGSAISPPPPPPPHSGGGGVAKGLKLRAGVGPKKKIWLKDRAGRRVKKVKAGKRYTIVVRDRSKKLDFHLTGPGVNRKTPVKKTAKATWKLKFKRGKTYRYRSDRLGKRLRGSFKAI